MIHPSARFGASRARNSQVAAILILVFAVLAVAQERSLEERADEYIAPFLEMSNFSGVILIAHGDEVLLDKGYGLADIEKGTQVTTQTRFQVGSIGRQFGATFSTAGDLFAWVRGFFGDKVVGSESREKMLTPNLYNYGYAWIIEDREGNPPVGHSGRMPGFASDLQHLVGSGEMVIVMSNIANFPRTRITADLLAIATGGEHQIPKACKAVTVDVNALVGAVGTYVGEDGSKLTVSLAPEFIYLAYIPEGSTAEPEQLPWYTLYPLARDRFFCKDFDGQPSFRGFVEGRAQMLHFTYNGEESDYRRVRQ